MAEADPMIEDLRAKNMLDSREYEILQNAVTLIKGVPGLSCELGMRMGGSSYLIMKELLINEDKRVHIGVDPYGNIAYSHFEDKVVRFDYTTKMKYTAQNFLNTWCLENEFDYIFFPLEDTEFFKRYADGVPVYNVHKTICNTYAFVFYDGPHTTQLVKHEIDFFKDRTPIGGVWVFDDVDQYPHMQHLDKYIVSLGFEIYQQGVCKISYIRKSYA